MSARILTWPGILDQRIRLTSSDVKHIAWTLKEEGVT